MPLKVQHISLLLFVFYVQKSSLKVISGNNIFRASNIMRYFVEAAASVSLNRLTCAIPRAYAIYYRIMCFVLEQFFGC